MEECLTLVANCFSAHLVLPCSDCPNFTPQALNYKVRNRFPVAAELTEFTGKPCKRVLVLRAYLCREGGSDEAGMCPDACPSIGRCFSLH